MENEYKSICDHGHFLSYQKQPDWADLLAEEWIKNLQEIYRNKGNDGSVNKPLVTKIGKELTKPIDREFPIGVDYDSPDFAMREALKRNVWKFSVAKNYNDNIRLSNLLLRPDGSLRPWNEFKKEALFVVGTSNRYLKTEYDTIVAGAQMSRLWQEIQRDKHIFPYVQLKVVQDDHTSEICSPLHNLIFEVDDPVLAYYFPPNHFNCRTTAIKLRNGVPSTNYNLPEIPEAFQNNVGATGEIFTEKNAYIENTPENVLQFSDTLADRFAKFQKLSADKNYYDVEFGENGGLKAIHRDHNQNKKVIVPEKEVQNIFFKNGDELLLLDESMKVIPGKKPDGIYNGNSFDMSTISGLGENTIKRALNHIKSKNAEVAVLYFPEADVFDFDWLAKSIAKYNGQTEYRFRKIIYIVDGKIYHY